MTKKYTEELERGYSVSTVMEEAQRCLLCYDAPCSKACPAGTDPAKFIRSVRFRNFKGAAETIRINNVLGAVCARVCPTERYCESGCSRCGIDKPIDIGGIQRFVTDFEAACGMKVLEKGAANGKRVAVVGSGPAGLQAAATLLQLGYEVEIFEKADRAGGFLRTIPEYRLPETVVDGEIERIVALGAVIHCGVNVDKAKFEELKAGFTIPGYIFFMNCEQAEKYRIMLLTTADPSSLAPMGIEAYTDMAALLAAADIADKDILLIPNGSTVVPYPKA